MGQMPYSGIRILELSQTPAEASPPIDLEEAMRRFAFLLTLVLTACLASAALAQDVPVGRENAGEPAPRTYSPYAGRNYPTQVFWGDTHLHTSNSLDARALGVTLDPHDAYRFARGEEVTATHGERLKLSRPLDWLVVSDHSDAMGAMNEIIAGDPTLMRDPKLRDWHDRLNQAGQTAFEAAIEVIETFAGVTGEKVPDAILDPQFAAAEPPA